LSANNPLGAFNFQVVIDGVTATEFSECLLPSVTIEVMEYRQGADVQSNIHKIPGLVKYGNLVLKRGIFNKADSLALWQWISDWVNGRGALRQISVNLLDAARNPVFEWKFTNAWPVKYESPSLSGKSSSVAIETLELAVDGVQVSAVGQGT